MHHTGPYEFLAVIKLMHLSSSRDFLNEFAMKVYTGSIYGSRTNNIDKLIDRDFRKIKHIIIALLLLCASCLFHGSQQIF